ncbi:MAG: helix-turn-helix domain-containing protein [Mycolicibacterium sp.]|nr:helix-turn-helix domain-containing protein [Mycolicibacterium sp.]
MLGLSGLLHDARGRDLGALAEVVEQSDPAGIRRALLHCDPLLRDRLLAGEDKALAEYLNQFTSKAERASALKLLEADAKSLAADTVELIRRWDNEVFSDLGPPIEAELRTAAHAAQRLINQVPVDRLIVRLTRGVEYRAEPWISKVILIPSVLSRPWVDISEYRDARIFFYPAAAESALPDVQLVDVYKALGDETRLRILRLMGEGVTGLTEIAERLGLAKSTVHGHMVILRSSGLTRSVVGVDGKGYVLNDRPDLNALLDGYLKS